MSDQTPAGWRPDPTERFAKRYFDGDNWTDHVANEPGKTSTDRFQPLEDTPAMSSPSTTESPAAARWMRRNLVTLVVGVLALLVGVGIGVAVSSSDDGDETATSPSSGGDEGSDQTTTTTTTTTTLAPYTPVAADFEIGIVELQRSCFGSAGCNITFRIEPSYVGPRSLDAGTLYTVLYEIRGGEALETNNFTIQGGQASVESESLIQTPPNPTLTAVPTQVLVD